MLHRFVVLLLLSFGGRCIIHRQLGVRAKRAPLFPLARQWSVSMCLFFLETMKLTFILLGSNTAWEEIIATPCCVLLVWRKEKTEEHVVLVQKWHAMIGGLKILPTPTVYMV